jgi:hypothetical protein
MAWRRLVCGRFCYLQSFSGPRSVLRNRNLPTNRLLKSSCGKADRHTTRPGGRARVLTILPEMEVDAEAAVRTAALAGVTPYCYVSDVSATEILRFRSRK